MANNVFAQAVSVDSISGPPSRSDYLGDRGFRLAAVAGAAIIILLVIYILYEIGGQAMPAIREYGLGFLVSSTWDVSREQFGILPEIWGTLYSSLLALLIGGFFGVTVAIFLTQGFLPVRSRGGLPDHRRNAGRHPQRRLRPLGHLRGHSGHPSDGELAARDPRLDPLFRNIAQRTGADAGRAGPLDHDPADGGGHLPGLPSTSFPSR